MRKRLQPQFLIFWACAVLISQLVQAHNISETVSPVFEDQVHANFDVIFTPYSLFTYTAYIQKLNYKKPNHNITVTFELDEEYKSLGLAVPVREIYHGGLGSFTVTHQGVDLGGTQATVTQTINTGSDGSNLEIEAVKFAPLGGSEKVATEYSFNSFLRNPAYKSAMIKYMIIPGSNLITATTPYTTTMPAQVILSTSAQSAMIHDFNYFTDTIPTGTTFHVFNEWGVNGMPWVSLERATYTETFDPDMRKPPIGAVFPQIDAETHVMTSTTKLSPHIKHFLYDNLRTFTPKGNPITFTFTYSTDYDSLMVGLHGATISDTLTYNFYYTDTAYMPLLNEWSYSRKSEPNNIIFRSVDYMKSPLAGLFPMTLFESNEQMGNVPVTVTHNNYFTSTLSPFDTGVGFGDQASWSIGEKNGIPDIIINSQGEHTVALEDRLGYVRFDGFDSNLGLHLYGPDKNFYGMVELKMVMNPQIPMSQFSKLYLYHKDFEANRYTSLFRENPSHRNFFLLFNDPRSFPDVSLQLSNGGVAQTIPVPSLNDPNQLLPAIQRSFGHLYVPFLPITHTISLTATASPAGFTLR